MSEQDFYVSGIALSQFVVGAERLGMDARAYVKRAGLDPSVHLNLTARVPMAPYEQVLFELILDSDDELFGAHVGEQMMLPMYGYLIPLFMSSTTLLDAIRAVLPYQALVAGNVGGFSLNESGDLIAVETSMAHQNPVIRRHITECMIALLAQVIRTITGRPDLQAVEVRFHHEPFSESCRQAMQRIVGGRLVWGQGPTRILLDREAGRIPLHGSDDTRHHLEALAQKQLEALQHRNSLAEDIKWHLRELIVSGTPRRITVADRLGISLRTLDRRLAEAGLSWQPLLDNQRSHLAREYLADADLTVAAIASRLGFSDVRAFQRRFRVWTGMSPSEYRDTLMRHH